MKKFGLIGFPLSHSFSKKYFTEKFNKESIKDACYELFELKQISDFPGFIKNNPDIIGLNVTIPYKGSIIPYLDELDEIAEEVGAVNTVKVQSSKLIGYNTDVVGFKESLLKFLPGDSPENFKAMILGTGGGAKAVRVVFKNLGIDYQLVSRQKPSTQYNELTEEIVKQHKLIINTTPLGMFPDVNKYPEIPYQAIDHSHFLFDLVYNPEETLFLRKGKEKGAKIKNGLEMLYLQAERSWEIWNG